MFGCQQVLITPDKELKNFKLPMPSNLEYSDIRELRILFQHSKKTKLKVFGAID